MLRFQFTICILLFSHVLLTLTLLTYLRAFSAAAKLLYYFEFRMHLIFF